MKKLLYILLTFSVMCLGGCGETIDPNQPTGFIQIKGSDTIVNAEQMVAEEFMKQYPQIFVAVTGGGTGVGIAALINKNCDIAAASREMKLKEIDMAKSRGVNPNEITVAYDGVMVIVNKDNPVHKLTIKDLHKIFTGEAKNWKEFDGPDLSIVTLSREVSSGTHAYFKEQVIHEGQKNSTHEFSPQTLLLSSSQTIVEEVAGNSGAIGYLGMGYMSDRTRALELSKSDKDFYPPTIENVLKKTYPLSRPLYFYTNGQPQGVTKLFIDFTLSPKGQQQFVETGFVPLETSSAQKN